MEDTSANASSNGPWIDSVVRLYIDGAGYFQGILVEVTPSGIVVDFPLTEAPELPVSEEVKIALSTDRMASSLKTPALVVFKGEDEYRCRYRFEISHEARTALTVLIDGRSVYRAPPDMNRPIVVTLWNDGEASQIEGILNDSSKTGMSVFIRAEDGRRLKDAGRIGIRLQLPNETAPIQMWGHVRHEQTSGWATRVGIEFEHQAAADYSEDQERFFNYVMAARSRCSANSAPNPSRFALDPRGPAGRAMLCRLAAVGLSRRRSRSVWPCGSAGSLAGPCCVGSRQWVSPASVLAAGTRAQRACPGAEGRRPAAREYGL